MSDHKTQITVAFIGLFGVVLGAVFTNWDKLFSREDAIPYVPHTVVSPSRTCKYTSGPKAGTVQYFSPEEFPIIHPAQVGQRCTDGADSWGVAIKDVAELK